MPFAEQVDGPTTVRAGASHFPFVIEKVANNGRPAPAPPEYEPPPVEPIQSLSSALRESFIILSARPARRV